MCVYWFCYYLPICVFECEMCTNGNTHKGFNRARCNITFVEQRAEAMPTDIMLFRRWHDIAVQKLSFILNKNWIISFKFKFLFLFNLVISYIYDRYVLFNYFLYLLHIYFNIALGFSLFLFPCNPR